MNFGSLFLLQYNPTVHAPKHPDEFRPIQFAVHSYGKFTETPRRILDRLGLQYNYTANAQKHPGEFAELALY